MKRDDIFSLHCNFIISHIVSAIFNIFEVILININPNILNYTLEFIIITYVIYQCICSNIPNTHTFNA